ncbi:hypothetical protein NQ315_003518 [Exocentrus adspersus]|uniref:Uncharacterized protein n=1 Tax=Exocentrus adspersus TaxID=1586481 RepID=A0AAV8V8G3_9CUCU|nr:hypothetical protein NQ315_003518 [Exocentrus adspersus]
MAAVANGELLSPYTVYKAKHLYPTWTEGGIPGTGHNRNSSGQSSGRDPSVVGLIYVCWKTAIREDERRHENAWSETFVEHLQNARTATTTTVRQSRGKKFNILPGQSVIAANETERLLSSTVKSIAIILLVNHQMMSLNMRPKMRLSMKFYQKQLKFRVAEKLTRYFIGKILKIINDNKIEISYLRKKSGKIIYFVYPDVPDVVQTNKINIVQKVCLKDIRRGKHTFSNINLKNELVK